MNVDTIVIEYLKTNGFDGLCHPESECGCFIDDFAPCGCVGGDCQPGKRVIVDGEELCTAEIGKAMEG